MENTDLQVLKKFFFRNADCITNLKILGLEN